MKTHLFRPDTIAPYCGALVGDPSDYGKLRQLHGTDDRAKFARIASNPNATFPACRNCERKLRDTSAAPESGGG